MDLDLRGTESVGPSSSRVRTDTPDYSRVKLNKTTFRTRLRGKTRVVAAWVFSVMLFFLAQAPVNRWGLGFILFGVAVRYWASGCLRKDQRPAVAGPYAYVRNPLYLGTWLMAVGSLGLVSAPWLALTLTIGYFGLYHFIVEDEETTLKQLLGEPYLAYMQAVPRFIPRVLKPSRAELLTINPEAEHLAFSASLAHKNKAFEAVLAGLGLWGWVELAHWVWLMWE